MVITFIGTIMLLRAISTTVFLFQSLTWLKRHNLSYKINSKDNNKPNVYILIPALREQKRIIGTMEYFLKFFKGSKVKLVIITTQREFEKHFDGPSTFKVVKNFIERKKLSSRVYLLDYPNKSGIKAHQLNYALSHISKDSFITVYDADSRPHPNTLEAFYSTLYKYPDAKVFQQSAVFLKNYDGLSNLFLKASAILQTRWTLTHEIPRLLRQSIFKNKTVKLLAYAHVVGHGLIIAKKTLKEVGGFPTYTITEDLFLGYLLRSQGYNIYPLPLLELADVPTTIKGLWDQKYVWFFGPLKVITYLRYTLLHKNELGVKNLLVPYTMTVEGLLTTLAWLLSGPFTLFLILSPLFIDNLFLVLYSLLGVFLYGPFQYFITLTQHKSLYGYAGVKIEKISILEIFKTSVMSIPAILFNSIPPYFALLTNFNSIITKGNIYKPKTDD